MKKYIILAIILFIAWCIHTGKIDLSADKLREGAMQKLKNEKTVNTVSTSRQRTQNEINEVTGRY